MSTPSPGRTTRAPRRSSRSCAPRPRARHSRSGLPSTRRWPTERARGSSSTAAPPTGGLEVLLAHPGGPYFADRDLGDWTIPKGEPDGAESRSTWSRGASSRRRPARRSTRRRRPSSSARSSRRAARSSTPGRSRATSTPPTRTVEHVRDGVAAAVGSARGVPGDRPGRLVRSGRGATPAQGDARSR